MYQTKGDAMPVSNESDFIVVSTEELRRDLAVIMDGVLARRGTFLVKRYGRPLAVICDVEDFLAGQDAIKALAKNREEFYSKPLA